MPSTTLARGSREKSIRPQAHTYGILAVQPANHPSLHLLYPSSKVSATLQLLIVNPRAFRTLRMDKKEVAIVPARYIWPIRRSRSGYSLGVDRFLLGWVIGSLRPIGRELVFVHMRLHGVPFSAPYGVRPGYIGAGCRTRSGVSMKARQCLGGSLEVGRWEGRSNL